MRLTNSGVKSTETRVTEILLENRNKPIFSAQYNNACLSNGLNIGLFQMLIINNHKSLSKLKDRDLR